MRTEVARLQSNLGTTTVYVTHDQTEAMTLGDRVAVMRSGVLQQVGSPAELYANPANVFVAGFIGSPSMNFRPGELSGETVKFAIGDVQLPREQREKLVGVPDDGHVIVGIRPEAFEDASLVGDARQRGAVFEAEIDLVESMGSELYVYFTAGSGAVESAELRELAEDSGAAEVPGAEGGQIVARLDPVSKARRAERLELWLDTSKLHFFDPQSGRSLRG
jgi:multiple sugar transport system ATP-binding protein